MNVLTVPRSVVALQYKVLRLPFQLADTYVVGRLLPVDSDLRLRVERSLASLDAGVGRLLQDDGLARRGEAVLRRADALDAAASLDAQAAARRADAEQTLEQQQAAADQREQAARERTEQTARIVMQEQADKRAAAEAADARRTAAEQAVQERASAELEAGQQRLQAQQEAISERTAARTAAPSASLDQAVARADDAAAERADAERLASLASAERTARRRAAR